MKQIPAVFQRWIDLGCISDRNLYETRDGFLMSDRSVADMLAARNIHSLSDAEGNALLCRYYYDDWYPFSVGTESVCGLLKMREQESDAALSIQADADIPGVTISFIAFDSSVLTACLENPTPEAQSALRKELFRVTAAKGQSHHEVLKAYFSSQKADAPYLIAKRYCQKIAQTAQGGQIPVPLHYKKLAKSTSLIPGRKRLPRFISKNNADAGYTVCDQVSIYIQDPQDLSPYEQLAILATHTGNVSFHSFAAEVVYHARFLVPLAKIPIPLIGWSVYSSAIRTDMSIDSSSLEAFAPFYCLASPLVRQQSKLHPDA